MVGIIFLALLILFTISVLPARRAATKAWRFAHEQGTGALVIRRPRPRDLGWGAALVPVAAIFLVLSGTFGITNVGGTGSGNLFDAKSVPGDVFYTALVLATVGLYTLVQPRRAGYLAAAGLTGTGAWGALPGTDASDRHL